MFRPWGNCLNRFFGHATQTLDTKQPSALAWCLITTNKPGTGNVLKQLERQLHIYNIRC